LVLAVFSRKSKSVLRDTISSKNAQMPKLPPLSLEEVPNNLSKKLKDL